MFVNNNGYAIHFNPLEEIRKRFSKEKNLPYNVPHHITLSNNTFFDNKKQEYTFFKDDYKDLNRNNLWNKNSYWGNQTGLAPLSGLEEKQPDLVLQNGFYFLKKGISQISLAGLPNFYNNIEGIPLNFDEAVSNTTIQKPLTIEQVIPKWMVTTLGDYYKTGKLSPELEARLKRISATRED